MILALLHTTTALAISQPVTVCVKYDTDYTDSDVSGATEDYFETNGPRAATGILVRATTGTTTINRYTSIVPLGGLGCAAFTLDDTQLWTVRIIGRTEYGSHSVEVRDSDSGGRWVRTATTGWTPVAGTQNVTLPVREHWNVLAAATQAMQRNDAGLLAFNMDFYTEDATGTLHKPAGCTTPTCVDGTDIYINNNNANLKYSIARLQGWAALHAMGYDSTTLTTSITNDDYCGEGSSLPFRLDSTEAPMTGFLEGFAHWYAATAFNRTDEPNCSYTWGASADWDQLSLCYQRREAPGGHVLSCATGPDLPPFQGLLPPTDYRGYCKERAAAPPSPSTNAFPSDSVVPLDVVRFLQERVLLDPGLSAEDIGRAYRGALPAAGMFTWRNELRLEAIAEGADSTDWIDAASTHGLDQ